MTQLEFENKAKSIVRDLINYIAQDEYHKISSIVMIDSSWCSENKTQADGILSFKEWLKDQLQLWSDDDGKEYIIDPFNEKNLCLSNLENNCSFSEYNPTSHGEELDFWFELDMHVAENDELIICFNINI